MSEAPKNGNGDGRHRHPTPSSLLASVSERLIAALPPAFLIIAILNVLFLGGAAWMFSVNIEARNVMLTKVIDACLLERQQR